MRNWLKNEDVKDLLLCIVVAFACIIACGVNK